MKLRVYAFILIVLAGMAVVPVVNMLAKPTLGKDEKWWNQRVLYNMDHASVPLNFLLAKSGISVDPDQVVVGRDGWYYLGDRYQNARTVMRRGQTEADLEAGRKIRSVVNSWNEWLSRRGVRTFRIMVSPNKETAYPEYLPDWAKPVQPTALDALLQGSATEFFVDLRPAIASSKARFVHPLYYRTDTHWNTLGAGAGFLAFSQDVARVAPELRWPKPSDFGMETVKRREGGDLVRFLRLESVVDDSEPVTVVQSWPVDTVQIDFGSNRVISQGGNPMVGVPVNPLLVKSPAALNKKRVLWLRDSFGTSMSPYMAATFSEVVQLHWQDAVKPGGQMARLVEEWKPDYVFMTMVERLSLSDVLRTSPPLIVNVPPERFLLQSRFGEPITKNDLKPLGDAGSYRVVGGDPFLDFPLEHAVPASQAPLLGFELKCFDNARSIPMQIFWVFEGEPSFHTSHSARFSVEPGRRVVDLSMLPDWKLDRKIVRLRMDIDAKDKCPEFTLHDTTLGALGNVVEENAAR